MQLSLETWQQAVSDMLCFSTLSCSTHDIMGADGNFLHAQDNAASHAAEPESTAAHRVLQAIAHVSLPHYGVQFHPESIGSGFGRQLMQNFRDMTVEWHGCQIPGPSATPTPSGVAFFLFLQSAVAYFVDKVVDFHMAGKESLFLAHVPASKLMLSWGHM